MAIEIELSATGCRVRRLIAGDLAEQVRAARVIEALSADLATLGRLARRAYRAADRCPAPRSSPGRLVSLPRGGQP